MFQIYQVSFVGHVLLVNLCKAYSFQLLGLHCTVFLYSIKRYTGCVTACDVSAVTRLQSRRRGPQLSSRTGTRASESAQQWSSAR